MTDLIYVCKTKDGKITETKSYKEAQSIKAEGGSYMVKYVENKTY